MSETPAAPPRRIDPIGLLYVLCTTVGWGSTWPVVKQLLGHLPPLTIRAVPSLIGVFLFVLLAFYRRESLIVPKGARLRLLAGALLNVTGYMTLATLALRTLTAGEGAILTYSTPVWATLLAWPILGERPGARQLIALLLALGGLAVLLVPGLLRNGGTEMAGILFGLGAALSFAVGTVVTKRWPVGLPGVPLVVWQVGLGVLPLALWAGVSERPDFGSLTAWSWSELAFLALWPLTLAYLTWFAALKRLPASVATMCMLVIPVVGMLLGVLWLGEPLGLQQVLALLLTVAGVLLAM